MKHGTAFSPRHLLSCLVSILFFGSGCGGGTPPTLPKGATFQARLFLDALKNRDGKTAYGLISRGWENRLAGEEQRGKALTVSSLVGNKTIASWEIDSEEQVEGLNKGSIKGQFFLEGNEKQSHPFQLIVVNEGGWKVDMFTSPLTRDQAIPKKGGVQ